jgi:hypothetical protein
VSLAGAAETLSLASNGLVNDGNVSVQSGTLDVSTDATGSGNWQADGGRLLVDVNQSLTTTGDVGVSNGGTLEIVSGATLTGTNLTMDPTATIQAVATGTVELSGDLSFAMTDEAQWSFDDNTTLQMTGGVGAILGNWSAWSSLEIGGIDIGTDPANNVGDPAGFVDNFDLATLTIGPGARVLLNDLFDNGNRNGTFGVAEALYVDTLVFADASALLNQNGLNIYYNTLVGNEDQLINSVVPVPAAAWLFVSGLIGLVGIARRRSSQSSPLA